MFSSKKFHFETTKDDVEVKKLEIIIPEVVDPQYGMFVWPSAPVLAQYLFHNQKCLKNQYVLELGAGTSLPGIVASKLGAHVTLSDAQFHKNCLRNCKKSCEVNNIASTDINIIPISWGVVNESLLNVGQVDVILGSDCFYNKKDFNDILFTVAFLLKINPTAVFLTTYQLRSCNYSIEVLLMKWKLCWKDIALTTFCFDSKYGGSDMSSKHKIQLFEIRKDLDE